MDILRIHNLYFIFVISLILSLFIMRFVLKFTADRNDAKSILLFYKFILLIFSLFVILFHLLIFLIIFITILITIFIKYIDDENYPYFYESFKKLKDLLLSQVANPDFIILISYYVVLIAILLLSWIIYNRVYKKGADYGKTKGVLFDKDDNILNDDVENPEKHYYWFSIYLITIVSFIILLLTSKYNNIQFSISLFFIALYYVLYLLHINYRIKKKNIKSIIVLVLLIILFSINAFIFNKY
jgi:hypothetical protein